jgi:hypothetical protein
MEVILKQMAARSVSLYLIGYALYKASKLLSLHFWKGESYPPDTDKESISVDPKHTPEMNRNARNIVIVIFIRSSSAW